MQIKRRIKTAGKKASNHERSIALGKTGRKMDGGCVRLCSVLHALADGSCSIIRRWGGRRFHCRAETQINLQTNTNETDGEKLRKNWSRKPLLIRNFCAYGYRRGSLWYPEWFYRTENSLKETMWNWKAAMEDGTVFDYNHAGDL